MVKEPSVGTNIGDKAPELALSGVDGKEIKLSDLKGQIVLIDFGPAGVDHAEEKTQM